MSLILLILNVSDPIDTVYRGVGRQPAALHHTRRLE
jgi:hypothetical protein